MSYKQFSRFQIDYAFPSRSIFMKLLLKNRFIDLSFFDSLNLYSLFNNIYSAPTKCHAFITRMNLLQVIDKNTITHLNKEVSMGQGRGWRMAVNGCICSY